MIVRNLDLLRDDQLVCCACMLPGSDIFWNSYQRFTPLFDLRHLNPKIHDGVSYLDNNIWLALYVETDGKIRQAISYKCVVLYPISESLWIPKGYKDMKNLQLRMIGDPVLKKELSDPVSVCLIYVCRNS